MRSQFKRLRNIGNKNTGQYLLLAGILFVLLPYLKKLFDFFTKSDTDEVNEQMLGSVKTDWSKTTISKDKAIYYAGLLYKAMFPHQSFSPSYDGTDEQTIFEVFSNLNTKDDVKAVYNAFGIKDYRFVMVTDQMDLIGWLKAELSDNYYNQLQNKIQWIYS